jgi:hypothetical protein
VPVLRARPADDGRAGQGEAERARLLPAVPALGPPQRDLAEFLCFVYPPNVGSDVAERQVDQHRRSLEAATGRSIAADLWRLGFAAALADLLIDKLAFYAMVSRVRPQHFLPRVMRTWRRLYGIFSHPQGS